VIEDALTRTEARLTDVQNLFDAGAATRSDVLRVDALVYSQQAAINDAPRSATSPSSRSPS
jgi:outer membrane protein